MANVYPILLVKLPISYLWGGKREEVFATIYL